MLAFDVSSVTFAVIAVSTSVVLVVALALCLCKQGADKSLNFLGDGNQALNTNSPVAFKVQSSGEHQNGDLHSESSPSEKVSLHPRLVTERALPTPPGRPQSVSSATPSNSLRDGAAADSRSSTLVRPHRRNKAHAPPPPPASSAPLAIDGARVSEGTGGTNTPSESSESDPLYSVATLRRPQSLDVTDNAPPIPEKRFDVAAEERALNGAIANAPFRLPNNTHAGPGPPAHNPDIPFVSLTLPEPVGPTSQASGTSDLSYTVISVREPLAKVREETLRQKPAQVAPTQEAYYTEVPEEEQMYAEIESGHNSAGSSVTYARIEPRTSEPQPPAPPTVESLKSVAQAHSRQASVTSASSLGAPSPDIDTGSLYTAVDKSSKQRQTIHISEGVASLGGEATNLDELYAKVHKPNHKPNRPPANLEDPPVKAKNLLPEAFSVHDRPRSLPPGLDPFVSCTNMVVVREFEEKNGTDSNAGGSVTELAESLPPPPEEYADPAYERVYHQDSSDTDPCYERVSGGHADDAVSDPGYEKVPKRFEQEPGYETIRKDASTEYSQGVDPGYERIRKSDKASSAQENDIASNGGKTVEHNYERIKGRKERPYDDASDPGYERIRQKGDRGDDEASDPGYERIRKTHSDACSQADSDPGYERIKHGRKGKPTISENGDDVGYEMIKERPAAAPAMHDANGSSDEMYESVADDRVRKLGYSLMKDAGSSGDSPAPSPLAWKQASDSSSASDRGATEDSSSEEPGYERVRHHADTDTEVVRPTPRRRLGAQAKVWRCSDSNLTATAVDTTERATSTFSLNANLDEGTSDERNVADAGAVLYEVVRDARDAGVQLERITDNEPVPIVWARNTGHRSSEHKEREYIF